MKVFLFDIDGTLVNTNGAGSAGMVEGLRTAFQITASSDGITFQGRTDRAIGHELLEKHGIEPTLENWTRFEAEFLKQLPQNLKSHQGHVLPGIEELLEGLSKRDDVALGLLTGNVREGARLKLEHYGIYHHFGFGGFGDEHLDRADVAREAIAEVYRHVGDSVRREEIWVIGDTPRDIQCARAVGVRVLAVATGGISTEELSLHEPDALAEDLFDPRPIHDILLR